MASPVVVQLPDVIPPPVVPVVAPRPPLASIPAAVPSPSTVTLSDRTVTSPIMPKEYGAQYEAGKVAQVANVASAEEQAKALVGEAVARATGAEGVATATAAQEAETQKKIADNERRRITAEEVQKQTQAHFERASKDRESWKQHDFWESRGTGNQILAAISVGLGGFAAAKTGGPNYALDIINKAMDRDIQKQIEARNNLQQLKEDARQGDNDARGRLASIFAERAAIKSDAIGVAIKDAEAMIAKAGTNVARANGVSLVAKLKEQQAKDNMAAQEHLKSTVAYATKQVLAPSGGGTDAGRKEKTQIELQKQAVDAILASERLTAADLKRYKKNLGSIETAKKSVMGIPLSGVMSPSEYAGFGDAPGKVKVLEALKTLGISPDPNVNYMQQVKQKAREIEVEARNAGITVPVGEVSSVWQQRRDMAEGQRDPARRRAMLTKLESDPESPFFRGQRG